MTFTAPASATAASVTTDDAQTRGDSKGAFSYSGTWVNTGRDHYSDTVGSSFTYRFEGTSVSLFGAKAPHHGQASVQIDDQPIETIDQYAPSRRDDTLLFTSPVLSSGSHVLTVTVTGARHHAATDHVVAIDRAVLTTTTVGVTHTTPLPRVSSTPPPRRSLTTSSATGPRPSDAWSGATVVLSETGDGPDLRPYASRHLNGDDQPTWHVEPGSDPVNRIDGTISKVNSQQFHRMFSTKRVGGPGKDLKIRYRARATAIRNRSGSSIVEGVKIGMKFPNPRSKFDMDDPRSAYGIGGRSNGPGSYQFVTGLTENGYVELSRNGYGAEGYEFFDNRSVGYKTGTWKEVTVTVEWLSKSSVRVRYWHNAEGTGTPLYEVVDADSPFAEESGFLWMRSDSTDWEYDYITVQEQ